MNDKSTYDSLDASDEDIFLFIPYILQDLWSLGSQSNHVLTLIKRNTLQAKVKSVKDLGCGKGEVLIKMSQEFHFQGKGIDIMPSFIEEARKKSKSHELLDRLEFVVGDIREHINGLSDADLVIYAHDADIFGDNQQTLLKIGASMNDGQRLVFESVFSLDTAVNDDYPDESIFYQKIINSGFKIEDKIAWDKSELKEINTNNNRFIASRINELKIKHKPLADKFSAYLEDQLRECNELENELQCITLLLRK